MIWEHVDLAMRVAERGWVIRRVGRHGGGRGLTKLNAAGAVSVVMIGDVPRFWA